jgi:hypothetical protein
MPGPWISNSRLRELTADAMSVVETTLTGRWTELIDRSNKSAAFDIRAALIGRGFTDDQIEGWDRRVEFNEDLGLFWVFVRANLTGTYTDVMLNKLDRRKELKDMALTVDGVIITPGGGGGVGPDGTPIDGGGGVSGGRFDQDTFRVNMKTVF